MNLDAKNSSVPATPVTSHPNPLSDLPDEVDALVIGGGIAGLSAAWQLTQDGLKPLLVEARGYLGGLIAPVTLARSRWIWALRLSFRAGGNRPDGGRFGAGGTGP